VSKGKIISLCDKTGNMVRPWADAGYECLCIDTQHSIRAATRGGDSDGNLTYLWGDVRAWWPDSFDDVDCVFAFPPCTHLAASGARDWAQKGLTGLIDALDIIEACRRICVASSALWLIENPKGRLNTIWREPDYRFHPCDYGGYLTPEGDAYTKETCLWTGGGFVMPEPRRVFAFEGSKMYTLPGGPSYEKQDIRSATPMGFATAVFEANHEHVMRKVA
jgi:hypothetical protein